MLLTEKQLELVDRQIKRLIKTDSFYGRKYRELGITECKNQDDFDRIPFASKDDLRFAYPLGIQAVDDREVVRIHSSSGTTGRPVIIPYTRKDVEDWAIMFQRCYEIAGITSSDRIHITPGYGLWTAGIGFQAGCERLGAMAIPMGPGNTDKQLQMM
ncbi:MAG TPA: phenylacetate--CoA ligase, partial [Succinivibrionaceae bacterium]|nr:phenylacetate--CoA ligase [Succinivibrionaceae bacterium]